MGRRRKSSFICHICRLPLSHDFVSADHPLFVTRDHVRPKALGGAKDWSNIEPAHRMCNLKKGSRAEITYRLRQMCLNEAWDQMLKSKVAVEAKWRTAAFREIEKIAGCMRSSIAKHRRPTRNEVSVWEGEGGSTT
jgi:5-methylcytosine-specific restriction endonuclease McrA